MSCIFFSKGLIFHKEEMLSYSNKVKLNGQIYIVNQFYSIQHEVLYEKDEEVDCVFAKMWVHAVGYHAFFINSGIFTHTTLGCHNIQPNCTQDIMLHGFNLVSRLELSFSMVLESQKIKEKNK